MRRCGRCKLTKPLSDFYRVKAKALGHENTCKNCERLRFRLRRQKHKEAFKKKYERYYKKYRKQIIARQMRWYALNKHKVKAHLAVKQALYKGLLVRQNCEFCDSPKSQAHHPDYNKPLEVRWLCAIHHRHVELGEI